VASHLPMAKPYVDLLDCGVIDTCWKVPGRVERRTLSRTPLFPPSSMFRASGTFSHYRHMVTKASVGLNITDAVVPVGTS
jgi:hypothetical protein